MEKRETNLNGCYVLGIKRFGDERGYFESITKEQLQDLGLNGIGKELNEKRKKGTMRIVNDATAIRCHNGVLLDIVVDNRKDSPTCGKYTIIELTSENGNAVYAEDGLTHILISLKDDTSFEYYENDSSNKSDNGINYTGTIANMPWGEIYPILKKHGISETILSNIDNSKYSLEKIPTNLSDCYILEPERVEDETGYSESISKEQLHELGFNGFFQISNSLSDKGTIRGLHFQKNPYCQAKVVKCLRGAVLDIVVDMREDSPTYGQYTCVKLTPENGRLLYVPRGFAHLYVALEPNSLFGYFVDNSYMPRLEGGILWNDPKLNIPWEEIFKKHGITEPILSEKDKVRCTLENCEVKFRREPKRYLVTGASGQLGYDIIRELHERGEYNILAPTSKQMDITNREQVMNIVGNYKPDVIYHCAAWTAVDKAEDMENEVYNVNVNGTRNLTDAAISVGAKIVYTSTDYVFDGTKDGIYTEEDKVNPMSVYGRTKYLGEEEVRRNPNHFITRISWVFGINGNNFIKTMLKLADLKEYIDVVYDQVGSPTYTVDLAKLLVEMAETDKYGTYNATNEGYCSWAEFAKYIMESNGKTCEINPVSTEEYLKINDKKQAPRPENSRLYKGKLGVEFYKLPEWPDAANRYFKALSKRKKLTR